MSLILFPFILILSIVGFSILINYVSKDRPKFFRLALTGNLFFGISVLFVCIFSSPLFSVIDAPFKFQSFTIIMSSLFLLNLFAVYLLLKSPSLGRMGIFITSLLLLVLIGWMNYSSLPFGDNSMPFLVLLTVDFLVILASAFTFISWIKSGLTT